MTKSTSDSFRFIDFAVPKTYDGAMVEVIQQEERWKTDDGLSLYCRVWTPEMNNPGGRALLVYTHGIESHTEWFAETGLHLAERGHPVVSVDRRGCGKSEGPPGHMDSYTQVLRDLSGVVREYRERWPERPVVGIGLSLGGLFMTALAMKYPGMLDGVVSLVPAIASSLRFPPVKVLEMLIASATRPRTLYPIPIETSMFTQQPDALLFIESDPLRMKEATARFFWSLLRMRTWVGKNPHRMKTPLLTLLAEHDEIIDNHGVREWLAKVPARPLETIEYPGTRHSLLFEPCRDRILEDIESFIHQVEAL